MVGKEQQQQLPFRTELDVHAHVDGNTEVRLKPKASVSLPCTAKLGFQPTSCVDSIASNRRCTWNIDR